MSVPYGGVAAQRALGMVFRIIGGVPMGHMASKDVYGRLARKMDNLHVRAPWNDAFHAILKELVGNNVPG